MGTEHWHSNSKRGKLEYSEKNKPVLVPLCPAQIPHGVAWDQTCASKVRVQQLTISAMAWPQYLSNLYMNLYTPPVHKLLVTSLCVGPFGVLTVSSPELKPVCNLLHNKIQTGRQYFLHCLQRYSSLLTDMTPVQGRSE
jgi:hypothetical protein